MRGDSNKLLERPVKFSTKLIYLFEKGNNIS